YQLPYSTGLKISALRGSWLQQDSQQILLQFCPEPLRQRDPKAPLRTVNYAARHTQALCKLLQNVLLLSVPQFPARWQPGDPLCEDMIQQRGTHLERGCHAHSVHFGEDIAGHVSLHVEIL